MQSRVKSPSSPSSPSSKRPIKRFEDILAWQKSAKLATQIRASFAECRDYNLRNQIYSASLSVMNNIAEGYERKGDKEFKRFLFIAKGSCGEVRSMLALAREVGHLTIDESARLSDLSAEISRMLSGLIKTLA